MGARVELVSPPHHRIADLTEKPAADVCPREFCFHFVPAGARIAPGLRTDVEAAMAVAQVGPESCCGCSFGVCSRLGTSAADADWYEPDEPALARAGLPWFFFISSADRLTGELREKYLREAAQLWGTNPTRG